MNYLLRKEIAMPRSARLRVHAFRLSTVELPAVLLRFLLCLGATLALPLSNGCNRNQGPERVVVSGTVTFDGKPIPDGEIRFMPDAAADAPVSASPIVDGTYKVDAHGGVPIGTHTVQVNAYRAVAMKPGPEGVMPMTINKPRQQYLPKRYNSDSQLKMSIESGGRRITKDFELAK